MPPNLTNTTLLILCGGQGRRMHGKDKPLITWKSKPIVEHILNSVPQGIPKLISANRNLETYQQYTEVVTDQQARLDVPATGPLLGILTGLSKIETPWLLVSPGDCPNVPRNWAEIMMAAHEDGCCCVVAHDSERQQHLHLLLHHSVTNRLKDYLTRGSYSVNRWNATLNPCIARFDQPGAFKNINQPDDLNE